MTRPGAGHWSFPILFLILILLSVAGAVFLRSEENEVRRNVIGELASISSLKAGQIGDWREDQLEDASLIAGDPVVVAGVTAFDAALGGGGEALASMFTQIMLEHDYFDILLIDGEGEILLSGRGTTGAIGPEAAAGLALAIDSAGPVFIDLHRDEIDQSPHVSVLISSQYGSGNPRRPYRALLFVNDSAEDLEPMIQSWPVPGETTEAYMIRAEVGEVRFLSPLRFDPEAVLERTTPFDSTSRIEVQAALGMTGSIRGLDYHGEPVIAVSCPVAGSPWILMSTVDESEVMTSWRRRAGLIAGILITLALALSLGALYLWQRQRRNYFESLYRSEAMLRASVERHSITLRAIGEAVISTDLDGRIDLLNPVAEGLTGWSSAEASGKPVEEVFRLVDEDTGEPVAGPVASILANGRRMEVPGRFILVAKNGDRIPVADSGSPILDSEGRITGTVLVFRDQSIERLNEKVTEARLSLVRYASEMPIPVFLEAALGEVLPLVGGRSGFFSLLEEDGSERLRADWTGGGDTPDAPGTGFPATPDPSGPPVPGTHLSEAFRKCILGKEPVVDTIGPCMDATPSYDQGTCGERRILVPVVQADRVLGVIGCYGPSRETRPGDLPILKYLSSVVVELVGRKTVDTALEEIERRYREIFEGSRDGIVITNADGRIIDANSAYCRMLGYTLEELRNTVDPDSVTPERWTGDRAGRSRDMAGDRYSGLYEIRLVRKDGTQFPVEVQSYLVPGSGGSFRYCWSLTRDVTEYKRIENESERLRTQLDQSQKLEAIGRLAGGVAHDFNNLLMGILNYAELCRESTAPGNPIREWLDEIVNVTNRSTELVKHLLAFARKQTISPRVVDVNDAITSMLRMLRRLIGEDIELNWIPGQGTRTILIDPSQFDQLLVNLALNARDAMDGPGILKIESVNSEFDAEYCRVHPGCTPGAYSTVIVSDSGRGMGPDVIPQIFEPFFTTKGTGDGSGLGLATVHGIVRQNNGFISVSSEPGRGTTFRVHFPSHEGVPVRSGPVDHSLEQTSGGETVLLVEDERAVRTTVEAFLNRLGYRVLTAEGPEQALGIAAVFREHIDLLLTDVVMPGVNVKELVAGMKRKHPGIRCLYMSGYTSNVIVHRGILDDAVDFLAKPFTRDQLGRKLREILERKG